VSHRLKCGKSSSESVRKVLSWIAEFPQHQSDASLMNARAFRPTLSKSLASLRHRLSHARVRSTTQRLGNASNPSQGPSA
jgi:hypothetical protein